MRSRGCMSWMITLVAIICQADRLAADAMVIPGFTAYMLPQADSARIREPRGVTRWTDATQTVNWYGQFQHSGTLNVTVQARLANAVEVKFRLTVDGQSAEATAIGAGPDHPVTIEFGNFRLTRTGYHRLMLSALNVVGPLGDIESLTIDGPATAEAHFNLKERRNAASVHLMFPVPKETPVKAFYNEVTAVEDPTTTFYMACGWHRGYFGMQVNSPTERRIIFSVWDSGDEAIDRDKVKDENRVKLIDKGEGVFTGDFGNEGTGGHSHLKVMWKTGETQRFIVTAEPVEESFTIFSGHWFHPELQKWMLISSWKAPKEGGWLRGLHGFSENFGGSSGHLLRKARFGNQWIATADDQWLELTEARFSHDATGKSDRRDRFMGVEKGEFFLSHGGFVDGFTAYGDKFSRPATGQRPADLPKLPPLR